MLVPQSRYLLRKSRSTSNTDGADTVAKAWLSYTLPSSPSQARPQRPEAAPRSKVDSSSSSSDILISSTSGGKSSSTLGDLQQHLSQHCQQREQQPQQQQQQQQRQQLLHFNSAPPPRRIATEASPSAAGYICSAAGNSVYGHGAGRTAGISCVPTSPQTVEEFRRVYVGATAAPQNLPGAHYHQGDNRTTGIHCSTSSSSRHLGSGRCGRGCSSDSGASVGALGCRSFPEEFQQGRQVLQQADLMGQGVQWDGPNCGAVLAGHPALDCSWTSSPVNRNNSSSSGLGGGSGSGGCLIGNVRAAPPGAGLGQGQLESTGSGFANRRPLTAGRWGEAQREALKVQHLLGHMEGAAGQQAWPICQQPQQLQQEGGRAQQWLGGALMKETAAAVAHEHEEQQHEQEGRHQGPEGKAQISDYTCESSNRQHVDINPQLGQRPVLAMNLGSTQTAVGLNKGQHFGAPAGQTAVQVERQHYGSAWDSSSLSRGDSSGVSGSIGGISSSDQYWQCTEVEAMPAALQQRLLELTKPEQQEGNSSRGGVIKGAKKLNKGSKAAGSGVAAVYDRKTGGSRRKGLAAAAKGAAAGSGVACRS